MTMTRVLLVDSDRSERDSLEAAFRREGFAVVSTADQSTLADVATSFRPDVAVVDVDVAPDGYAVARSLRYPTLPAVLLTGAFQLESRLAGFAAGADDVVGRPSIAELMARTKALVRRSLGQKEAIIRAGDIEVDDGRHEVTRNGHVIDLTPKEYGLLRALAGDAGRMLSKRQLLSLVWNYDDYDRNIVEVHISALRRKVEVHGPRVIHTVRSVGYILRPTAPTVSVAGPDAN